MADNFFYQKKAKTLLKWEPKGDLKKWLKEYVNKIS